MKKVMITALLALVALITALYVIICNTINE